MPSAFSTGELTLSLLVAVLAEVAALAGNEEDAGPVSLAFGANVVVNHDRLGLKLVIQRAYLWRSPFNLVQIIDISELCIVYCKPQLAESVSD